MVQCIGCLLVSVPEIYGDSLKSYKTYYLKNKQTKNKPKQKKQNKTREEERESKELNKGYYLTKKEGILPNKQMLSLF